jgi:hypothetical protein
MSIDLLDPSNAKPTCDAWLRHGLISEGFYLQCLDRLGYSPANANSELRKQKRSNR